MKLKLNTLYDIHHTSIGMYGRIAIKERGSDNWYKIPFIFNCGVSIDLSPMVKGGYCTYHFENTPSYHYTKLWDTHYAKFVLINGDVKLLAIPHSPIYPTNYPALVVEGMKGTDIRIYGK